MNLDIPTLLFANVSIKSSIFNLSTFVFDHKKSKAGSLSCEIVDLRNVVMIFNLENESSARARVNGSAANSAQAVANSGIGTT